MPHLQIVVPPDLLFYNYRTVVNGSVQYGGLVFDIFHEICRVLSLTYDVIDADGYSTKNTGVIDLIAFGKADMAVGLVTATDDRMKKVDFLTPFYNLEMSFATASNDMSGGKYLWKLLKPFTSTMWWVILGSFLLLLPIFHLFYWIQGFRSITDNFLSCFRLSVRQSISPRLSLTTPIRVITASLLIGSLILVTGYSANLVAMSAVVRESKIDTFAQLSRNPQYKVIFREGSAFYDIFMASRNPTIAKIRRNQLMESTTYFKFSDDDFKKIASRVIEENLVFISGHDELLRVAEKDCRISLSREKWNGFMQTFAVSKHFKYEEQFNFIITQLWSSGIVEMLTIHHRHRFFQTNWTCISRRDVLSLEDVTAHFTWMGIGLTFATMVLILEVLHYRLSSDFRTYCVQ